MRLRGHAAYDTCDYLQPGESDGFFARDPVPRIRAKVVASVGAADVGAFLEVSVRPQVDVERTLSVLVLFPAE